VVVLLVLALIAVVIVMIVASAMLRRDQGRQRSGAPSRHHRGTLIAVIAGSELALLAIILGLVLV
jgi:heme/copper-type cytochrome/quinol oxidase subunit 2